MIHLAAVRARKQLPRLPLLGLPSVISGVARLLDFGCTFDSNNLFLGEILDVAAVSNDWEIVGGDVADAVAESLQVEFRTLTAAPKLQVVETPQGKWVLARERSCALVLRPIGDFYWGIVVDRGPAELARVVYTCGGFRVLWKRGDEIRDRFIAYGAPRVNLVAEGCIDPPAATALA